MAHRLLPRAAGILLLQVALLPSAFSQPPFRPAAFPSWLTDQPGVLSRAEIGEAIEAMKAVAGNVPEIKPVASGVKPAASSGNQVFKAPPQKFALFDTSYRKVSDHVMTATRVECYTYGGDKQWNWQCQQPYIAVRIASGGAAREVRFSIHDDPLRGQPYLASDPQTAADIVEFVASPCFGAKYAAVARPGDPPAPASPAILAMSRKVAAISVFAGEASTWDTYDLKRIDADKAGCRFEITRTELAKDRALLAEKQAQERAKQFQEAVAKQAAEARQRAEATAASERHKIVSQRVGLSLFWSGLLCGLAALAVPWFLMRVGRWAAAGAAGGLTGAFIVLNVLHAQYGDTGHEVLITLLVALLTFVLTAGLLIWAIVGTVAAATQPAGQEALPVRPAAWWMVGSKGIAWILWILGLAVIVYVLGPWFFWPR